MKRVSLVFLVSVLLPSFSSAQGSPQEEIDESLPAYLRDRGTGTPTSMFGTYVRRGELLIYPFVEYYFDNDAEYAPSDFGMGPDRDFRGRYRATEGLIFLGYGLTSDIAMELEAAVIDASLEKSDEDYSGLPAKIEESGLGDVQTQVNWRWMRENEERPELFSYLEIVFPLTKDKDLIGTKDWEFKAGTGVIRGFSWGTTTFRAAVEYSREESKFELGEIAVEYLRRLSPSWRLYLGVEGAQDEIELITEMQWHLADFAFVKLNNAFGVTSKATDWAPELGIVFKTFP